MVKDFLNTRIDKWDVVIIGHSRGGIFANDLSAKLVGYGKIANLHTVLLDPTATSVLADFYPMRLPTQSPTNHYGSLYYNNTGFLDDSSMTKFFPNGAGFTTIGDINIPGYDNYGNADFYFNSNHADFPYNWLPAKLQGLISNIKSRKDYSPNGFVDDGGSGMEVVRITRRKGFITNLVIELQGDNVHISGTISLSDIPGAQVTMDITVGKDGLAIGASVGMLTTQTIINGDRIVIANNLAIAQTYTSISSNGIQVRGSTLFAQVGAGVTSGGININIDLGLIQYKGDPIKTVSDAISIDCCHWW